MTSDAIIVVKLNIEHYERLLQSDLAAAKRATVERLLMEERRKLAELEAGRTSDPSPPAPRPGAR